MANTLIMKKSSTAGAVPGSEALAVGELAVNLVDQAIYSKNAGGTVVRLAINGPKITVGTTAPSSPAVGDLWVDTN